MGTTQFHRVSYKYFCLECGYEGKGGKGCRTCGRKKRKKPKTNEQIIKEDSFKEREEFLDKVATGLDNFNMESCGDSKIDKLVEGRRQNKKK